jgi:hypothetical protein
MELMRASLRGPDRSLSAAGRLEDALLLAFPKDDDAGLRSDQDGRLIALTTD